MYKPTIKAPTKQWKMLELGLKDLALVQKDPRYTVDMNHWHSVDAKQKCHVCLAGAVMAKTGKAPLIHVELGHFSDDWQEVFERLNDLRNGWYVDHHDHLTTYDDIAEGIDYEPDPAVWRAEMVKFMNFLKEQDL